MEEKEITPEQKEAALAALKRALAAVEADGIIVKDFQLTDKLADHRLEEVDLVHIAVAIERETQHEMMKDNGFNRLKTFNDLVEALALHF